tara:strand:- start:249 stop:884 length:636 start_codon:yes stop_codon:yes gene_type:complete
VSEFNKMDRNEKRSARLLALQLIYANEISEITLKKFSKEIFNISSDLGNSYDKHELLSKLDIQIEMALSILPDSHKDAINKTRALMDDKEQNEIENEIKKMQRQLNLFKKNIQNYGVDLASMTVKKFESLDEEIISRSKNWDFSRITLMDKLILRMVIAEILYIDHVPPKVSIAEGIEIAKIMSTDDSSAFVNGILDSFYNDWTSKKEEAN